MHTYMNLINRGDMYVYTRREGRKGRRERGEREERIERSFSRSG